MTIKDMYSTFASNSGPKSSGEFLAVLTDRLMERMAPIISQLDEEIDDIEDQIIEEANHRLRGRLGSLRR